jgi:hypothetical protein
MHTLLWIGCALLVLAFTGSGSIKLARSRAQLLAMPPMAWAEDFGPGQLKLIGLAEVLGALGIALSAVAGPSLLSPVCAACLALLMAGAIATHLRRGEAPTPAAILAVLCIAVAVGGFLRP